MVLLAPRNDDYVTLEKLVSAVQAHVEHALGSKGGKEGGRGNRLI